MTIDSKLQNRLDHSKPDDPIDIQLILKASTVRSNLPELDPSNIIEERKIFARIAKDLLHNIVLDVSSTSGQQVINMKILENVASARILAPAALSHHGIIQSGLKYFLELTFYVIAWKVSDAQKDSLCILAVPIMRNQ